MKRVNTRTMFWGFALWLALAALLSGCGSSSDDGAPPSDGDTEAETESDAVTDPKVLAAGDYSLSVLDDPQGFALKRGEQTLLRLPLSGLVLGRVAAIDDKINYDPYPLIAKEGGYAAPKGLSFVAATAMSGYLREGAVATLNLSFEGGAKADLRVELSAAGRYRFLLTPGAGQNVAYIRVAPRSDATEGFYGLGEYFDSVNHRGKLRAMQLEGAGLESGYNEAHVPVPFVVGTTGWGFFVNNLYPAVFDVASSENDKVEAVFGTGAASPKGLEFYLFAAPSALDVTRHYYDVTGYPKDPARWALGPWVWRDELSTSGADASQTQALADMRTMRELDLPASGYWIDRPYASGVNSFDFNPAQFSDAAAMIKEGNDLGYRLAIWHAPYVSAGNESTEKTIALDAEAKTKGYYPPKYGIRFNKWGTIIDFTNPDAYAWWLNLLGAYKALGIEGYKLDYAEDVVPGLVGARNKFLFADGSDERTMHARYPFLYHAVYGETLPKDGGFLLCRAGAIGEQVNGCIIWPGDLDADMSKHGDSVTDADGKSYGAVGGLPASVIAGNSLGVSGYPYFGSDSGGYRHSPPSRETFIRWFTQTALSSVMQIGTSSNNVGWEWTKDGQPDTELLDWYREFTRLHLRLWAYEWSYVQALKKDGRAIQRPLGLIHPELGHPDDTYYFGDHLLVSPVVTAGASTKNVPFPAGSWQDWFSGERIEGGATKTVQAPLGTLPLYLAEGGIVPLLRPTIDTLAPTTKPAEVDSYATDAGLLYARVFPGKAETVFTLFDGTQLKQKLTDKTLTLESTSGTGEFKKGVIFELYGVGAKPAVAALSEAADLAALQQESVAGGWAYTNELGGHLWVKLAPGRAVQAQVTLGAK